MTQPKLQNTKTSKLRNPLNMSPRDLLSKIKEKGISKWYVAKTLGVSWNTVHLWEKGAYKTSRANILKLRAILNSAQ